MINYSAEFWNHAISVSLPTVPVRLGNLNPRGDSRLRKRKMLWEVWVWVLTSADAVAVTDVLGVRYSKLRTPIAGQRDARGVCHVFFGDCWSESEHCLFFCACFDLCAVEESTPLSASLVLREIRALNETFVLRRVRIGLLLPVWFSVCVFSLTVLLCLHWFIYLVWKIVFAHGSILDE